MAVTLEVKKEVFNPVYWKYLTDETRTQIFFGGSASGKSRFLAQRCVIDICRGGRNYLVVRKVAGTIRRSCFNEIIKTINEWGLKDHFTVNQSELVITCKNGYQILFCGCDDVEKLKSITPAQGVISDVWYEEATEADSEDIKQLEKRLRGLSKYKKRITLSFNPIIKTHWIYSKYFSGWEDSSILFHENGLLILKTTYKDNKFLSPDDVYALENEPDKYFRDVYTYGNWGVIGGVIFKNWSVEDLSEKKKVFDNYRNGLDFGFAADEAAIVRMHYDKKHSTIYILEEFYEKGVTNDRLAEEAKKMFGNEIVTCDSAEPKSIVELQQHGVKAKGAKKGRDSVLFGIQWLQQQKIVIDINCHHTKAEFQQYKWQEDKDGSVLPKPVGKKDHIISSVRYGLEDDMGLPYSEPTGEKLSGKDRLMRRYYELKKVVGYGRS